MDTTPEKDDQRQEKITRLWGDLTKCVERLQDCNLTPEIYCLALDCLTDTGVKLWKSSNDPIGNFFKSKAKQLLESSIWCLSETKHVKLWGKSLTLIAWLCRNLNTYDGESIVREVFQDKLRNLETLVESIYYGNCDMKKFALWGRDKEFIRQKRLLNKVEQLYSISYRIESIDNLIKSDY
ncbi:hypothetical protein RFI_03312, partial [Reticulomyxa filosa]